MSLQTMAHFLKLKFSWLLPKCPCEADNFYLHTPLLQIFFCTPPSPPNQPRLSQALSFQFSSVTQSWLTQHVMNCSMPGLPAQYQLPESTQTHIHRSVMPSNHLILCHLLLLLPSSFPSIRVFSNESALCIRWPKHWSFSFNISLPMNNRTDFL